jgi:hypothetical protein|mmetsp:Transcript_8998/g.29653  ORF Transcript_8998/g.29653 Transcript_8998/m.29653 type:complete len:81 (-) Transcript_8998:7-249(-)
MHVVINVPAHGTDAHQRTAPMVLMLIRSLAMVDHPRGLRAMIVCRRRARGNGARHRACDHRTRRRRVAMCDASSAGGGTW